MDHEEEKKSLKDLEESAAHDSLLDDSKANFIQNGGQDTAVVIVEPEAASTVSFTGLGKEDLMKYAKDPFWVRVRIILFVLFWVAWFGMLVAAIIIIVLAPRCPERKDMKWYEQNVAYQIFPKSFKDTTLDEKDPGAGIGDLNGVAHKISYLQNLGVGTFWLNSIYETAEPLDGEDVVDHRKINSIFGTQDTFDVLRKNTKKKGMKMMLDFIPNHTSKKHKWFNASQAQDTEFEDFYVWADGQDATTPPNNWRNQFGDSAWTYDDVRKQFYYHSSLSAYPDLNLRSSKVKNELDGILRHWLNLGVDGFFVKDIEYLVEHNNTNADETSTGMFTTNQMDSLPLISRWRAIVNEFSDKPGRERALVASLKTTQDTNMTAKYYDAGIHVMVSTALTDIDPNCDAKCFEMKLNETTSVKNWHGWMLDNDEISRFASRVPLDLQKAFQALNLLLPGTAFTYYGDEIAMTNGNVLSAVDPLAAKGVGRDNYRTPMLWSDSPNGGFCPSGNSPWLPINDKYKSSNVEYNTAHFIGYTIFESFKALVALREKESFQFGSVEMGVMGREVLYFTRKAPGFPSYLVAMNIPNNRFAYNFGDIANKMTLVYHSEAPVENLQSFNTADVPIAFKTRGEVFVFEF